MSRPEVIGIDIDLIQPCTDPQNIADPGYASVVNGAAVVSNIGRPEDADITGAALDYHAGIDKMVLLHKDRIWFYNFTTSQWEGAATPLIEVADCTVSGTNTSTTPWPVTFPAANTGDLLVVCLGWDDSVDVPTVTAPAGPNGEVAQVVSGPVASVGTEVRSQVWSYVATGPWTAGNRTFTPSAAESRTAVVIRVPAGEFDQTERQIGAAATKSDQAATSTSAQTPAFTALPTDGGGRLVAFVVVDTDPVTASPAGWTTLTSVDVGVVAHRLAVRDLPVTNSEAIASASFTIAGDTSANHAFVIRRPQGISLGFAVTNAYHNLGHYNPTSRWFVGGGGAREDPVARNYEWVGVDPTGTIVPLDPSTGIYHPDGQTRDVCFSLSESVPTATKACGTASPGSTESIFFHDNGWIYGLDPTRAPGTQWRCIGAVPVDVEPIDWCCTVPEYGVILIGSYGGYGTNRMRVYRP